MLTFGRARVNCRLYRQTCNTVAAACYSCPRLRDRTARAVRKSSTDPVGAELSDRPSVRLPAPGRPMAMESTNSGDEAIEEEEKKKPEADADGRGRSM